MFPFSVAWPGNTNNHLPESNTLSDFREVCFTASLVTCELRQQDVRGHETLMEAWRGLGPYFSQTTHTVGDCGELRLAASSTSLSLSLKMKVVAKGKAGPWNSFS